MLAPRYSNSWLCVFSVSYLYSLLNGGQYETHECSTISKDEIMCTSFLEQGEQGYAWSRYLQVKGGYSEPLCLTNTH